MLDALYNMSDHLPVMLELEVADSISLSVNYQEIVSPLEIIGNPFSERLVIKNKSSKVLDIVLFDLLGKKVYTKLNFRERDQESIPTHHLGDGIYILKVEDRQGNNFIIKLTKISS